MVEKAYYIKKFQELYERKTGEKLSDDLAMEYFEKLVVLIEAVYAPIPKEAYERKD